MGNQLTKKVNFDVYLTLYTESNVKWIINLKLSKIKEKHRKLCDLRRKQKFLSCDT